MDYRKMTKGELLGVLADLEKVRQEPDKSKDLQLLIEELHIHQVELEMQNRELQDTQLELELERDRYHLLFNAAPVSYLVFDARGFIVDMNLASQELLGRSREECIGAPFYTFIAPGHVRGFLAHLRQSFQSKEQLVTEIPLAVREGEITVQTFSVSLPDPSGVAKLCRSAMIDVTERRQIERQLQESEERYRRLFYPISDAVLLVDQEKEAIIDNNAAALTLFGYSSQEMLGLKLATLFVDEEKSHQVMRSPTHAPTAVYTRRRTGETFPAEASVYRFVHRGLLVAGITIRDLTGQRRKEELHRHEEEQFRAAVKSIPLFFAIYDHEGRYRFTSATTEELLHHTAEELDGKRDEDVVSDETRREYLPLLHAALTNRTNQAGHAVFHTSTGPVKLAMEITPMLGNNGTVTQVVAVGINPAQFNGRQ
jgi:PAS domain S-box-containing protein